MQTDRRTTGNERHHPTNVCVLQTGMKAARRAQRSLLLSLGSSCPWVSVAPGHWEDRETLPGAWGKALKDRALSMLTCPLTSFCPGSPPARLPVQPPPPAPWFLSLAQRGALGPGPRQPPRCIPHCPLLHTLHPATGAARQAPWDGGGLSHACPSPRLPAVSGTR